MLRTSLASGLLASLLLSGCGGGDPEPTVAPEPVDQAAAAQALSRALDAMLEQPSIDFRFTSTAGGETIVGVEGTATGDGYRATLTPRETSGQENGEVLLRAARGKLWMQQTNWPVTIEGCWLTMAPGDVPLGVLALQPDQPIYFSLLAALEADGFDPEDEDLVIGTADLATAVYLLNGETVQGFGLAREDYTGREVAARITVSDGQVSKVVLSGADLSKSLTEAGAEISEETAAAFGATEFEATYEVGEPFKASAPRPAEQFTEEDQACRAAR